jgi:hypothetical protein
VVVSPPPPAADLCRQHNLLGLSVNYNCPSKHLGAVFGIASNR